MDTDVGIGTEHKIQDEVLELAYKKALIYAHRKLSSFYKSGLQIKVDALDVTNEAVSKTLSGTRPWNREKVPDLFVHLAGCIRSIIHNAYTATDFQLVERDSSGAELSELHTYKVDASTDADAALEFESKVEFLIDYLVSLKDDVEPVANMMFKSGITEPSDIAEELGLTVAEVNSKKLAIKRMMTRTEFLLHYISKNRKDLIDIAQTIYRDNIVDSKDISKTLGISTIVAKAQKSQLYSIVNDIYRGGI